MDSMIAYKNDRYLYFGRTADTTWMMFLIIFRQDLSGLFMILASAILGFDGKNAWRIFKRDRYNHASPNSAQTEAVCAGALDVQLAGDAWYFGVLHTKSHRGSDPSGGAGGYPAGKPTHVRNGGDRADPAFRSVFSPILGDPVGALCKNKTEMKSIGFCREPTANDRSEK